MKWYDEYGWELALALALAIILAVIAAMFMEAA